MITSREASTISWSEMPGLTVTFVQEDGLFVISRYCRDVHERRRTSCTMNATNTNVSILKVY